MKEALATLGILIALCGSLAAASFTVTNTADSGAGSLRQAMLDSEGSPGADEIVFAGVTGTITLQTVLPTVRDELAITGPGAEVLKISGNNRSQILVVASGAKIRLSGVT